MSKAAPKPRLFSGYSIRPEAKNVRPEDRCYIVPCSKGRKGAHLYVHSNTHFGYSGASRYHGLREALLSVAGAQMWQNGDEEFSIIFPNAQLAAVAPIVEARHKRKGPQKAQEGGRAAL